MTPAPECGVIKSPKADIYSDTPQTAEEINAVANTLNTRPRKTLAWRTPAEALNEHLRSLQQPGVATTT